MGNLGAICTKDDLGVGPLDLVLVKLLHALSLDWLLKVATHGYLSMP